MSTGWSETSGRAGFGEVGDPDRPAVADQPGERVRRRRGRAQDRPEVELVAAPRRAAGPDVLAVLDAARRVPGRQLDEVADLLEVGRIGVGDDVEPALAGRVRRAAARRAGAQRAVGVARIERADDQLALRVELHVLVLPVAARGQVVRDELVEQLRLRRIAHVVGLEPEAPRDHQDVLAAHLVELALGDAVGLRHPCDVLEVRPTCPPPAACPPLARSPAAPGAPRAPELSIPSLPSPSGRGGGTIRQNEQ